MLFEVPWEGWTTGLAHEDWRYIEIRRRTKSPALYWVASLVSLHLTPTLLVFAAALALRLMEAVVCGATNLDIAGVDVIAKSPFDTDAGDVMAAHGIILGTTENLGYMSGALKDFFDRCYYPLLDNTQGLPYALYIRAGLDGTGATRGVESITTGLKWKIVQEPLLCHGKYKPCFLDNCRELGSVMAAGLEAGLF